MNAQELLKAVGEFLGYVARWAWGFARRHSVPLIGSALAVIAVSTLWDWYRGWMTEEVVLLGGPAGGSWVRDAARITKGIEAESTWYGKQYRVRTEQTEGFEENRRRISDDQTGRMVGFAHDGFGEAENVRVIYPLEWNILHVFCRKKWLQSEDLQAPESAPRTPLFSEIVGRMAPGRIAFGPPDSGTRQLAALVMGLYGREREMGKLQAHGVVDWNDMRGALNNGSIDLAFYTGPLGVPIVADVARDGSCVLADLGADCDAIRQGRVHIQAATLAANSYSNAGFCPRSIATLATRRVLICSAAMGEGQAYFLSREFQDVFGTVGWEGSVPLKTPEGVLSYRLHPGAVRVKNAQGAPWSPSFGYFWSIIGLWLCTEAVKSINALVRKRTEKPAAVAQPASAGYDGFKREIELRVRELERAPLEIGRKERKAWEAQVADFRQRVRAAHQAQALDATQTHTLLEGAREWEHEIELRRRRARAGA
jgi:hypothetical protein